MAEYIHPNIQGLTELLNTIPSVKINVLETNTGKRGTRPFFNEAIYPIRVEYEEAWITVLVSGNFGDFVGIETFAQPTLKMVNEVINTVNEFYNSQK